MLSQLLFLLGLVNHAVGVENIKVLFVGNRYACTTSHDQPCTDTGMWKNETKSVAFVSLFLPPLVVLSMYFRK